MMPRMFKSLAGCFILIGLIAVICWALWLPTEPSWNGRSLSAWLEAYDSHNRFEEGDYRGLRSPLGDEEIERALDQMEPEALPVLLEWLTHPPGRLKPRLNRLVSCLPFVEVRFEERDYQSLACTGFMAYHTNAQSLLPELVALSYSANPQMRMLAYEAAFFTRPERDIFMPLVERALAEPDQGVQAMAEQWLMERYPDEAETQVSRLNPPNARP